VSPAPTGWLFEPPDQQSRGGAQGCSAHPGPHCRPRASPRSYLCLGRAGGLGGPRPGAAARAGCRETPERGSQREKPEKAVRRPRPPACHAALPSPGALCLPAIFGSPRRAPLGLLITRVRNAFGLSYIRKGGGSEAAKYTGACGSKREALAPSVEKSLFEQWKDGLTRQTGPRTDGQTDGGMDGGRRCPWACTAAPA